jgi:F0F1-type ATP synthase assembly protein I
LSENSLVKVKGILNVRYNKGGFYPELEALSYEIIEETSDEEKKLKDKFLEKLNTFIPRTFNYIINSVINNVSKRKLKCLVIHGQNAQTQHDFINSLRQSFPRYQDFVKIENLETSLNDESLEKVIREKGSNYDIIFLVRGGGSSEELSKIGGIKSAIAVLEIGKPFFIAIGHSQDRNVSLLEKVCDYAYHTPSALGTQFGEALKIEIEKEEIKQALNEKGREKEREKEDLRQVLLKEKEELERKLSSLIQNLKNENKILKNKANKVYVYMIAGIVVGIAVGIALASIILKS